MSITEDTVEAFTQRIKSALVSLLQAKDFIVDLEYVPEETQSPVFIKDVFTTPHNIFQTPDAMSKYIDNILHVFNFYKSTYVFCKESQKFIVISLILEIGKIEEAADYGIVTNFAFVVDPETYIG